jgi:very-short-patch-repair endonuclease
VARIAARQHGVATLTQLKSAGLSPTQVRDRLRSGRLHRIHRGVYAVGHAGLDHHGRWLAAVLAYRPNAWLSHRSAAELWELLRPRDGPVDVLVRRAVSCRPGVRLHRSPSLPGHAITRRHGIPVTTPARTLRDLKRVATPAVYRRATRRAEYLGLPLGDTETDRTRSEAEREFLRLCRRRHLPEPEVNVRVGPLTVDFLWREARLVVEVDGWSAHRGRQAHEDDHDRELVLHRLGYGVRRFTPIQLDHSAAAVARIVLDELLGRARAANTPQ